MPISHTPRNHLPTYNAQGQCISGSYPASTSRASTSCVTTPGPIVYDISNVEIQDDICQVGDFYNTEFLSDIPSSWLRHFGIMIDTGTSASVTPPSFAAHVIMTSGATPPYLRRHLWAEATVLPVGHNINAAWIFYIQNRRFTDSNGLCLNDIEHSDNITDDLEHTGVNLAKAPVSKKASSLPSQEQTEQHSLTHQPFRSWCPICQRARGRQGHHRRQPAHEQPSSINHPDG